MNFRWFSREDWPMDYELKLRKDLMQAIAELPNGGNLSDSDREFQALTILHASYRGRDEELPRNQKASQLATDTELRRVHDLCVKLIEQIEGLHAPAVRALAAEEVSVFNLAAQLRDAAQGSRHAFGFSDAPENAAGRPRKIEAATVTLEAATVFETVTGRRPTFTTDPETSVISGDWPEFLTKIFDALPLRASVEAQVRAQVQKASPI